ncbi:MAG: endonuclease/exonuclease/phosphatase family protein [Actinobacteria bacterium]|nr:endonuclease/exonuclease/phosphatase family protein [Actinomycetota bacterium]
MTAARPRLKEPSGQRPHGRERPRPPRWPAVFAGVYAAVTAATIVAWFLVGDLWWTQPVHATTFYWPLPAVPLAALALVRRRWRVALLLAVPAGLFVTAYGGLFVGASPAVDGDVRVASYNTYIRSSDLSHVFSIARAERPDVLLVQEITPRRAAELEAELGDTYPHRWFGDEVGRVGGVGVLSRFPIVALRPVPPPRPASRPTAVVHLDVGGRPLQIVPVHLTSPCPDCGASLLGRQRLEVDVRRAEIDAALAELDPDIPAVVGGDLNSTRRSDPYRHLVAAGFRDPQIEAGAGPGFTWPAGTDRLPDRPLLRIDWVMARGMIPVDAWVASTDGSDHRPVLADLAWPGGAGG